MEEKHNDIKQLEERVAELESRLAFQDQTIEELNQVVYRQQGEIDGLRQALARLERRLGEILPGSGEEAFD